MPQIYPTSKYMCKAIITLQTDKCKCYSKNFTAAFTRLCSRVSIVVSAFHLNGNIFRSGCWNSKLWWSACVSVCMRCCRCCCCIRVWGCGEVSPTYANCRYTWLCVVRAYHSMKCVVVGKIRIPPICLSHYHLMKWQTNILYAADIHVHGNFSALARQRFLRLA